MSWAGIQDCMKKDKLPVYQHPSPLLSDCGLHVTAACHPHHASPTDMDLPQTGSRGKPFIPSITWLRNVVKSPREVTNTENRFWEVAASWETWQHASEVFKLDCRSSLERFETSSRRRSRMLHAEPTGSLWQEFGSSECREQCGQWLLSSWGLRGWWRLCWDWG